MKENGSVVTFVLKYIYVQKLWKQSQINKELYFKELVAGFIFQN